jgi:hypothetical protein
MISGFTNKDDHPQHHLPPRRLNTSRELRVSNESIGSKNHSRNHSDGSGNSAANGGGSQGRDSPIVKHYFSIKNSCFVTCGNSALCS